MPSWRVSIPQRLILLPKTVFSHLPDMPVIKSESDYGDVITVKLHSVPKIFLAYSQTRCSAQSDGARRERGEGGERCSNKSKHVVLLQSKIKEQLNPNYCDYSIIFDETCWSSNLSR